MKIFFTNSIGYRLTGVLNKGRAIDKKQPVVIFSHGFDSSKESPRGTVVAGKLVEAGIAAFLFDFTGHGESEGTKDESTIERQVDDLNSAISFIKERDDIDGNRVGATGASSGGLVALKTALVESVNALVLRGPRTDDMTQVAGEFEMPIRIIQGELDPPLWESRNFFNQLKCKKDFRVIKGSGHLFEEPEMLEEVAELTTDWFLENL